MPMDDSINDSRYDRIIEAGRAERERIIWENERKRQELTATLAHCDRDLRESPESIPLHHTRITTLAELGALGDSKAASAAEEHCIRALEIDYNNGETHAFHGKTLEGLDKKEEAIQAYLLALGICKTIPLAREGFLKLAGTTYEKHTQKSIKMLNSFFLPKNDIAKLILEYAAPTPDEEKQGCCQGCCSVM